MAFREEHLGGWATSSRGGGGGHSRGVPPLPSAPRFHADPTCARCIAWKVLRRACCWRKNTGRKFSSLMAGGPGLSVPFVLEDAFRSPPSPSLLFRLFYPWTEATSAGTEMGDARGGGGRAPPPLLPPWGVCLRGPCSWAPWAWFGHRHEAIVHSSRFVNRTVWMPPSGVSKGIILGTREMRCPLFWSDVPSQSPWALPVLGSLAGRPCAPGRAWEHPSGVARWARLPIRSQVRRLLRPQKSWRHKVPWLEGLREGGPGSRGQPGVGVSCPAGCQGHGGRDAGKPGCFIVGTWARPPGAQGVRVGRCRCAQAGWGQCLLARDARPPRPLCSPCTPRRPAHPAEFCD